VPNFRNPSINGMSNAEYDQLWLTLVFLACRTKLFAGVRGREGYLSRATPPRGYSGTSAVTISPRIDVDIDILFTRSDHCSTLVIPRLITEESESAQLYICPNKVETRPTLRWHSPKQSKKQSKSYNPSLNSPQNPGQASEPKPTKLLHLWLTPSHKSR
jgi:hypothetical protein